MKLRKYCYGYAIDLNCCKSKRTCSFLYIEYELIKLEKPSWTFCNIIVSFVLQMTILCWENIHPCRYKPAMGSVWFIYLWLTGTRTKIYQKIRWKSPKDSIGKSAKMRYLWFYSFLAVMYVLLSWAAGAPQVLYRVSIILWPICMLCLIWQFDLI